MTYKIKIPKKYKKDVFLKNAYLEGKRDAITELNKEIERKNDI